jgi:hypothetical protein
LISESHTLKRTKPRSTGHSGTVRIAPGTPLLAPISKNLKRWLPCAIIPNLSRPGPNPPKQTEKGIALTELLQRERQIYVLHGSLKILCQLEQTSLRAVGTIEEAAATVDSHIL